MKTLLSIFFIVIPFQFSLGQEYEKGTKLISISVGGSLSNLLNSEPPHKISLQGSDIYPGIVSYPITASGAYFDYTTSILKDVKSGLVVNGGIEYFLKDRLSICVSVSYEEKGINLDYKRSESRKVINDHSPLDLNFGPQVDEYILYYDEFFQVELRNRYLTMPVLIKKYFSGSKFYFSGGGFAARLMATDIYTFKRKHSYTSYDFGNESDSYGGINHEVDKNKEFTNEFDYGVSLGTGLSYPLTKSIFLDADLLFSLGLRQVDGKYNNEYEERRIAVSSGFAAAVRSTNYFGLNSNATNISAALTFGIRCKIR